MNWISCKDRLPDDGKECLIATKDWVIVGIYKDHWGESGAFSDSGDCGLSQQPTHWMPLPELPRAEK